MTDIQNIAKMEEQVEKIKDEQTRCKTRTLKKLDKLYEVLNGNHKNSEEEAAVAVPEPVAQV
jgi:hypothetical protein